MEQTAQRKGGAWVGLFWIGIAGLTCYGAGRLGLGSITDPGAGFILFWPGVILAFLSLRLMMDSRRGGASASVGVQRTNWIEISFVLAALLLYAFFLERLGFVASTFLLLSVLLTLNGVHWGRVIVVAAGAALGSFAVFELWLRIRLPRGIFGF
jgi:putative tricarboxylic transport membrane protein